MYVSGVIRPSDIADGQLRSTLRLIADARVEFTGRGDINDQVERGWLNEDFGLREPVLSMYLWPIPQTSALPACPCGVLTACAVGLWPCSWGRAPRAPTSYVTCATSSARVTISW